ncbi:hypothetical protein MTQ10_06650 [Streptomyces sp. XM83C]|jgi:hypothetical protein|uniref:hypothetical protein n=1 Tax=unclassified Streptomyces TaxID=2593676 RepID=UPI001FFA08F4|nr:hypothetical protein [Streptomyces sp. XM83C]MCK1819293.1 hypothetical protein [Streptomyces sp. XM83C]
MPSTAVTPADRPVAPPTVWTARGRHLGYAAAGVVRKHLKLLKDEGTVQDFMELPEDESPPGSRAFEARWRVGTDAAVPGEVTVRARLTVAEGAGRGQEWTLLAEAERAWDLGWPAPSEMFWPRDPDGGWPHESSGGSAYLRVNALPEDDKALRRVLREATRDPWDVHVVVHEAMTPDERGRASLMSYLPLGLRHRVVEHRAAPQQLSAVNYALRDAGLRVPRGGALILPGTPAPEGVDQADLTLRTVFLDGSEPVELVALVTRFATAPRPLPQDAAELLTAVREQWHLFTLEEELHRERELVAMYAEALEAMTRSRDLYREAAERAQEALAAYREAAAEVAVPQQRPGRTGGARFPQLTRTLERLKDSAKAWRPPAPPARVPDGGRSSAKDGEAGGTTRTASP